MDLRSEMTRWSELRASGPRGTAGAAATFLPGPPRFEVEPVAGDLVRRLSVGWVEDEVAEVPDDGGLPLLLPPRDVEADRAGASPAGEAAAGAEGALAGFLPLPVEAAPVAAAPLIWIPAPSSFLTDGRRFEEAFELFLDLGRAPAAPSEDEFWRDGFLAAAGLGTAGSGAGVVEGLGGASVDMAPV